MAETTEGQEGQDTVVSPAPGFDEAKLADMIQAQASQAFSQVLQSRDEQAAQQYQQSLVREQALQSRQGQADPLAEWIKPYVAPGMQQSAMQSAAAMDLAEFYQSEEWDNLDNLLDDGEMSQADLRKEKQDIKKEVEETFKTLMQEGRPTNRKSLLQFVVGKRITNDQETFVKRASKKAVKAQANELEKARRQADPLASTVSSLSPAEIYALPEDKFNTLFGDMQI